MATQTPSTTKKLDELYHLIEGIEIAMLTTLHEDGSLRSRPMQMQQVEFDGTLWFFTPAESTKVHEIEQDRHVNVAFSAPEQQHYVSMCGRARLVRDRAKIDELWNPALKAWFPEGKEDPNVALLKIEVEGAEYWDSPSSAVAHAIALVGSLVTGKPADPGENETIELSGSNG